MVLALIPVKNDRHEGYEDLHNGRFLIPHMKEEA